MKELLKITNVKDDVCEISANLEINEDVEMLSAALLGAMCQSEDMARAVMAAANTFVNDKEEVTKVTATSSMPVFGQENPTLS